MTHRERLERPMAVLRTVLRLTHGEARPSYREVAAALGLPPGSGEVLVHRAVVELEAAGYVRRVPGRPR